MLGRSETLALHHRQKYNNEVYNTVIRSVCQQLLLRVMVWAGRLLIENKERKLHSSYFPSYTEMLFLQITSQLWNYETMKKAIFLEGPLQKWTITWSCLHSLSCICVLFFFFFFFFNKDDCVFASPTHTEEGNRFFRETWLMHFLMHFPAKNRKILKIGFVEDIFRTFSFLKYVTIFF